MKAKGGKKKFGNFKLTGAKFKRFQWFKKNQNQKTNVNYNLKDDDDEVNELKQNENLFFGDEFTKTEEDNGDDDEESGLIFKTKKKKQKIAKTVVVKTKNNNKKKSSPRKKKEKKIIVDDKNNNNDDDDDEIELLNTFEANEVASNDKELTVFNLNPDGSLPTNSPQIDSKIDKCLQKNFNFKNFKPLQKDAILRVLCGQSTIALFSTGYGKSLIYQICTKFYRDKFKSSFKCLVLVISPLISLMNDQLVNLNKCINGASCDSQMDEVAYKKLMENLNENKIDLLFLSPEALLLNKRLTAVLKEFKILFVCIDEIHCLSQWSHNFRPSYLQICKILQNEYNVNCILGLTATATPQTINELKSYFHIDNNNILRNTNLPQNLILSVSKDANKEQALISLLKSSFFIKKTEILLDKIIIYCNRREQTDKLATLLRMTFSYLHDNDTIAKKFNFKSSIQIAESYHAGLSTSQRKRIQTAFLNGKLRIIIATLAFGMGINMKNIRAVIHYNMPKAIESYVQEIGMYLK